MGNCLFDAKYADRGSRNPISCESISGRSMAMNAVKTDLLTTTPWRSTRGTRTVIGLSGGGNLTSVDGDSWNAAR